VWKDPRKVASRPRTGRPGSEVGTEAACLRRDVSVDEGMDPSNPSGTRPTVRTSESRLTCNRSHPACLGIRTAGVVNDVKSGHTQFVAVLGSSEIRLSLLLAWGAPLIHV